MRNLRKVLGAWLLVFSLLLGMMPVGFAAGDTEISLSNGDFESGNTDSWTLSGYSEVKTDTGNGATNTTKALNLWLNESSAVAGSAAYTTSQLDAGSYYFTFDISGKDADSGLKYAVTSEEKLLTQSSTSYIGKGWNQWDNLKTEVFTLSDAAAVTFTLSGTQPAAWWGYLDNLKLYKTDGSGENPPAVGYAVKVTADKTNVSVGDKITVTAQITNNGQSLSELDNLDLWFFPDSWKDGHTDGISASDSFALSDNSGKVFSTEVTLKKAGTYYMAAQLKNGKNELAIGFVTITVTAAEKPPVEAPDAVSSPIYVPYIPRTKDADFIRGVDVSSLLSILNSGAHYYDADGKMLGTAGNIDSQGEAFMQLLADSGVNWVRLRIWPDPYDSNHKGYGGGNNDLEAAKTMGKWVTDAGMKVLIDFHYSDFWCDPAKQKSPKAWADLDLDARVQKVSEYTKESLDALIAAGVDVRMVQVGNETNNGICGVMFKDGWANAARIFAAGCDAVHDVQPLTGSKGDILAAVHFANPEKTGTFAEYAKNLDQYNVNYDVFASSYYPYWHGSIENLQSILSDIATKYGKKVMVAETSWAWTLADGDGHDNTVRTGSNDENPAYVFSVQGQATEVATVMQGIADIDVKLSDGTPAGIGVFYWEPAWIPVKDISGLTGTAREPAIAENRKLWNQYGSGWAASYSVEYDPEDAGLWYGGSAVDNQSVFDFGGKALESLNVFKYVTTGTKDYKIEVVPEALSQEYAQNGTLSLPNTVVVTPSVGDKTTLSGIEWNSDSVSAVQMDKPGTYTVTGTVTGMVAGEERTIPVTCTVTVRKENFLTSNPSFEEGNTAYILTDVPGKGITNGETGNARSGTWCLHYYQATPFSARVEHNAVTLEPGTYEFGLYTHGMDSTGRVYIKNAASGKEIGTNDSAALYATKGWRFWQVPVTRFTLTERTAVIPGLTIDGKAEAWGAADDWYIEKTSESQAVTGVTLEPDTLTLDKDETAHLTATVLPENAANKRLIWSVSDPNIVEVDSDGSVTALAPGEATITVTTEDGGYTDTCEVIVLRELSVTVESDDQNDHLSAEFVKKSDTIKLSGAVSISDGDSRELTLHFVLPNGDEETETATLHCENGKLSIEPAEITVNRTDYTLDISEITLLDSNVTINGDETDVTVREDLTLKEEEAKAIKDAAESLTGDIAGVIAGAADELAKAGKDALLKAGESADVKVLVYMKVEATGYTSPDSAAENNTLPSLKLDITPVYKIVDAADSTEIIEETELKTNTFPTPIEITVTLPEGFVNSVSEYMAAKHYGNNGQVKEWLDVQLSQVSGGYIAAFLANSFSEYELTVSPTVTAIYHALNGEHTAIYHYARIGKTEIPVTEQQSNRFLGWSRSENASAAEYPAGSLTQALIDQMYASLNADGEIHLYPVFRSYIAPPVVPDNNSGGTSHAKRDKGSSVQKNEPLTVSKESADNGTFSISPRNPEKGDRVTITVSPDEGYLVDTVTVTDKNGRSVSVTEQDSSTYIFTMPSTDVTVSVNFRPDGASPVPVAVQTADFVDVSASDWFQNAVNYVSANGIMAGNGSRFSPNDRLTRGMMAQILYNLTGGSDSGSQSFPDVSTNDWFAPAVSWAASQGFMNGYGSGKFGPNDPITREQVASILYRYAQAKSYNTTNTADLTGFADVSAVSGWAQNALGWAVGSGLISGTANNRLDPVGNASRAEIAQVLMLFHQNMIR